MFFNVVNQQCKQQQQKKNFLTAVSKKLLCLLMITNNYICLCNIKGGFFLVLILALKHLKGFLKNERIKKKRLNYYK